MHVIGGGLLKAKDRDSAMKEGLERAESFAFYNVDRGENPNGSYNNYFSFYNETFNTEEEAYRFFDELGAYCDGVCMISQNGEIRYFAKYEVHC